MRKDIAEKRLEDCNDVFADIFNTGVFKGKQILREDHLVPLPTESFTRENDAGLRQGFRDIRKADGEHGHYRLICGLENQDGYDNTMPQRIMGYDYATYEEQIKKIIQENKKNQNPAYTKRIHDGQLLTPSVTAVVYWGDDKWQGPRSLHDMLQFPDDIAEELKPFVSDYPLHIIEAAHLPEEVRKQFTSDFRLLAEYLACRKDPVKRKEFMRNHSIPIRHPEEFLDVFSAVAGEKQYKEFAKQLVEKSKTEEVTMCELYNLAINQGKELGLQEGKEAGLLEGKEAGLLEGKEAGLLEGKEAGLQEGIRALIEFSKELGVPRDTVLKGLMQQYHISREQADEKLLLHWGNEFTP